MIVWLASYPRSGNTFLRIVLNRMYGVRSSTVYDTDGVAERLGADVVGAEAASGDLDALRRSSEVHFIKTHRQADERIGTRDRAIYLVRDGRDALVSYARQRSEGDPARFEAELEALIRNADERGTGGWGANVLSWTAAPRPERVRLHFDELVLAPAETARRVMMLVAPSMKRQRDGVVPEFSELAGLDPGFFRRGVSGSWRDEMPERLHDLFWANADNCAAMEQLGVRR